MDIITQSLPSAYLEEIREPARERNLQAVRTLTCDGLPHFPSRAIDSFCNHPWLLGDPRTMKIPPSPPFFKGGLGGIYGIFLSLLRLTLTLSFSNLSPAKTSSQAEKCQVTSL